MQYNIKKAKIKGMTLEVEMEEIIFPDNASPITNDVIKKSDQLIHEDLRAAFNKLKPHLVLICDQKEDTVIRLHTVGRDGSLEDQELIDDLQMIGITGYVIGGSDENEGVTLIGSKKSDLGTLNLISPFTKYAGDYKNGNELASVIEACNYEVEQYLFQGKCAVKQMELPFDGESDTDDIMVTMMVDGAESAPIDLKKINKRLKKLADKID
jgi:hypothetical protein